MRADDLRARWQLWVTTFVVIGLFSGALIFVATRWRPAQHLVFEPARVLSAVALGCIATSFVLYVIGRERNLSSLARRLIAEQVERAQLAERIHYLAQLTRERDTNAALIDGSADGVAVVDEELRVLRFNRALEEISGVGARAAMGMPLADVLPMATGDGEIVSGAHHPARAVLLDGIPRAGVELRLRAGDGGSDGVWVSGTFSPIRSEGAPPVVLVSLRDIRAHKEQQVMQRDFVSMAAHELRTPLTAIKGFTRTMMLKHDRISDERRMQYLSLVNDQSNRLALLVDDLLQVSRIDSQRVTIEREPVELASVSRSLVEQFRTRWAGRTIDIHDGAGARSIPLDRRKIEEVLINLIDNAVKYSPAEAPVRVEVTSSDDAVHVRVRDRGLGIPPHEIATLFQKFHRLHAAATSDIPGTGLGLYIVKGLVEAHGGSVTVESVPGVGSTFCVSLPAEPIPAHVESVGA